jgi:hypothetical protein
MIKCDECGAALNEGETYELHGKVLCEDCYMYETNPPKACDPMAVSTALSMRKRLGQTGTTGLTPLQKQIYCIIEEKGKVTKEELAAQVGLKPEELEQQFAILRHCELIRATKEGGKVYLTKWQA